tara:strand:+ start:2592 stop:3410 length:819 start_codon:yes stop_codon:yes gene_type:complete
MKKDSDNEKIKALFGVKDSAQCDYKYVPPKNTTFRDKVLFSSELDHVVNAVNNAEYYNEPYEHCYIKNIFSDWVYEELLRVLPPDDEYYFMKHPELSEYGTESPRLRLELDKAYIKKLPKGHVLRLVNKILHSKELKDAFFTKFKATLEINNRHKLECTPQPCFMRDKKGYKIKPHPDSGGKIITFAVYLPEDNSHEDVGTIVNTKDVSAGHAKKWQVHRQFKFHRNTAYAFPVTKTSWHSVDTLSDGDFDRNSLFSIYYHKRSDKSTWATT